VLKLRDAVDAAKDGKDIVQSLQYLHQQQYVHPYRLNNYLYLNNPISLKGLFVSNWTKNDVYHVGATHDEVMLLQANFGSSERPTKMLTPGPPIPWLSLIIPDREGDGVEWRMTGSAKVLDRLDTLDLKDPNLLI
jgi:hypothetical protein